MTDEECARRVSAIQAEARQRVPEWEPWMTAKVGYAGAGNDEARKERRRELDRKRYLKRMAEKADKARRSKSARARYLRRAADPEAYERYLAKARAAQAVRDAAKRASKT